ncbi:MAG: hypothetical protein H0T73_02255 [Ardenticatenales bacterium]|nr:hypothetical protein [Ardenticatenales bacterium]
MSSRLLSETLLTFRPRPEIPIFSGVSRAVARRVMVVLTLLGLLLFLYLAEVSQGTTTAFDIEQMEMEFHQLQERNQALEAQIAARESPTHVMRYAEANGMTPRTTAEYLVLGSGQPQ